MSVRVIGNFSTLMQLASEIGKAKKNGTKKEIKEAQRRHDEYKSVCLESDEMSLNLTFGDLGETLKGQE